MANFNVDVDFVDHSKLLNRKVKTAMKNAMTDVVLDIKRVSSLSAPHDSGFLSKSAQHEVYIASQYIEGSVGFSAMDKGFNYAEWTHEEDYELGKKSKKKKGGKSKFGSGTVPVGTGYLDNTITKNKAGYLDHLEQAYRDSLS